MADAFASQPSRFLLNGLVATAVHFLVLAFCLHVLQLPSAGASNVLAALVGITASFFGSRHYVFRAHRESIWTQVQRFWLLYLALSLVQGLVLFLWSDLAGLDYRAGFLIGVVIQAVSSYYGGRHWVFRPRS